MARKNWKIVPCIKIKTDTEDLIFYILPTMTIQPWQFRDPNSYVLVISWLIFHVGICKWKIKRESE